MIDIVPEDPARHAEAIESLYDRTFGPGHFAKTAERLRENNFSVPSLNRVALVGEIPVAVVRLWPVQADEGRTALFVGPVAVDPAYRGARLGLNITSEALDAARQAGWPAAVIIGNPAYFGEIGFLPVPRGQLRFPGPQDPARIMYCDLAGDCRFLCGDIRCADGACAVDNTGRRSLGLAFYQSV